MIKLGSVISSVTIAMRECTGATVAAIRSSDALLLVVERTAVDKASKRANRLAEGLKIIVSSLS